MRAFFTADAIIAVAYDVVCVLFLAQELKISSVLLTSTAGLQKPLLSEHQAQAQRLRGLLTGPKLSRH